MQLSSTWTTINGINGRKFTANNGNYIFLPAAGYYELDFSDDIGHYGHYSSSSMRGSSYAYCLRFRSDYVDLNYYSRNGGRPVRAVLGN